MEVCVEKWKFLTENTNLTSKFEIEIFVKMSFSTKNGHFQPKKATFSVKIYSFWPKKGDFRRILKYSRLEFLYG